MNTNLNRGLYEALEAKWAEALSKGSVKVDISVSYKGNSIRPDKYIVNYWINGVKQEPVTFKNSYGGK